MTECNYASCTDPASVPVQWHDEETAREYCEAHADELRVAWPEFVEVQEG